jgi:hypothetical protein
MNFIIQNASNEDMVIAVLCALSLLLIVAGLSKDRAE